MTVLLTLVGIVVFAISTFTVGFVAAFKRLVAFTVTGLVLDVIIVVTAAALTVIGPFA